MLDKCRHAHYAPSPCYSILCMLFLHCSVVTASPGQDWAALKLPLRYRTIPALTRGTSLQLQGGFSLTWYKKPRFHVPRKEHWGSPAPSCPRPGALRAPRLCSAGSAWALCPPRGAVGAERCSCPLSPPSPCVPSLSLCPRPAVPSRSAAERGCAAGGAAGGARWPLCAGGSRRTAAKVGELRPRSLPPGPGSIPAQLRGRTGRAGGKRGRGRVGCGNGLFQLLLRCCSRLPVLGGKEKIKSLARFLGREQHMEGAGRERGCRAAPARGLEGQEPGWDPPELPALRPPSQSRIPSRERQRGRPRSALCRRGCLVLRFCPGLRWAPCRLGHSILFHIAERLHHVTVWAKTSRTILPDPSLGSPADPSWVSVERRSELGTACHWRLGAQVTATCFDFFHGEVFLETQVCRFYARFVFCVEETCQRFRR